LTSPGAPDHTAAGMARILVIEDDPEMQRSLEKALRLAGHEVTLTSDGQEGMKSYRLDPAAVVITDLFMPNQDGIETMINLRREFPEAKIVAISGNISASSMLSVAKKLGAIVVLEKPFAIDALLAAVDKAL